MASSAAVTSSIHGTLTNAVRADDGNHPKVATTVAMMMADSVGTMASALSMSAMGQSHALAVMEHTWEAQTFLCPWM